MKRITLIASLAALSLAGCSDPTSFEELTPDIQKVEDHGEDLKIEAKQNLVTEGLAMTQLGSLVGDIARGVQGNFPGVTSDTKRVHIVLSYSAQDKLGNEGEVPGGMFTFIADDLRAAKAENLAGTMWLELVDQVVLTRGGQYMVNHCLDASNIRDNEIFCGKVADAAAEVLGE